MTGCVKANPFVGVRFPEPATPTRKSSSRHVRRSTDRFHIRHFQVFFLSGEAVQSSNLRVHPSQRFQESNEIGIPSKVFSGRGSSD